MANRSRAVVWRLVALAIGGLLIVAACSDDTDASGAEAASAATDEPATSADGTSSAADSSADGSAAADEDTAPADSEDEADTEDEADDEDEGDDASSGECEAEETGSTPDGPSTEAATFDIDGVQVDFAVYPRPEYEGKPWSDWGQGVVLPDGRYLSAIGDHLGQDGNSYLYVFDPDAGRLTQFSDVQSLVDHEAGSWGYGKIHAQMVQPTCDSVVFATYWGNRRGIEYSGSYTGDYLFRLDPSTLEIEPLGVPIEGHGIPSLATADGLIYGEAAAPIEEAPPERGVFFVYDPESEEVVYQSDDPTHTGFRSILVADDGSAFVAADDSKLLHYEPGGELATYPDPLPAGWIRAVAAPTEDGTVYGVSTQPDRFFAYHPDGSFEDLGPAQAYTASIDLLADGRIIYVPDAHGDAPLHGTSVFAFDPESGTEEALVQLNETAERELGLTLGGTYSIAVDEERNRIFIGFNAGTDPEDPWGEVVLAVIHL
jgi:hypothetical protein